MADSMSIRPHSRSCEDGACGTCLCYCASLLHNRAVLDEALQSHAPAIVFERQLQSIFGSAFADFADPQRGQRTRRKWLTTASAGSRQWLAQRQQRIVDVTLRDVLALTHQFPVDGDKTAWLELGTALRANCGPGEQRHIRSREVTAILRDAVETAGQRWRTDNRAKRLRNYFWPAVLAAAAKAAAELPSLRELAPEHIINAVVPRPPARPGAHAPRLGTSVFCRWGQPDTDVRPTGRRSQEVIAELCLDEAVAVAADIIAPALTEPQSSLSDRQRLLIVRVVSAASCPDLWRAPAVVRYALLPAVQQIRNEFTTTPNPLFHLDNAPAGVCAEHLISRFLLDRWRYWPSEHRSTWQPQ